MFLVGLEGHQSGPWQGVWSWLACPPAPYRNWRSAPFLQDPLQWVFANAGVRDSSARHLAPHSRHAASRLRQQHLPSSIARVRGAPASSALQWLLGGVNCKQERSGIEESVYLRCSTGTDEICTHQRTKQEEYGYVRYIGCTPSPRPPNSIRHGTTYVSAHHARCASRLQLKPPASSGEEAELVWGRWAAVQASLHALHR